MRPEEVAVQRRITRAFVDLDGVEIQLRRTTRPRNNRGGLSDGTTTTTPPRRVKLSRHRLSMQLTTAGQKTRAYDHLVADLGTDVRAGDEFDFEGLTYRVMKVKPRPYELVADLEQIGGD